MKILIIGSGGREHAIALKLFEENRNNQLFISPGNGGTEALGENITLDLSDSDEIIKFCKDHRIDLVFIGPEKPLVDGLADTLRENSLLVFGPNKKAARIEGNKEFSKNLMREYNIPTAEFKSFSKSEYDSALQYLSNGNFPIVLKASGLAAGKGVIIANDLNEAKSALDDMMVTSVFGSAGDIIVIEEFLEGEELSIFAVTDGNEYVVLPASQDHKRIGEGDKGKNTGGMGAYAPLGFMSQDLMDEIENKVIIPTLKGLSEKNSKFNGCLYCGLIKTEEGVKVIEFNCRFGDPEIQAVIQLLNGNFFDLIYSTACGKVRKDAVKYTGGSSMCVVAASGGYPEIYEKGFQIEGLPLNSNELKIIHAGTEKKDNRILTSGGRVLNIVAISSQNNLKHCKTIAYNALSKIKFNGIYFRNDIGFRALK